MPAVNFGEGGGVYTTCKVGSKIFRIFKNNFQIPSHLFSAPIQDKALLLLLGRQGTGVTMYVLHSYSSYS